MADLTPIKESTMTDVGYFNSTNHYLTGFMGSTNIKGRIAPFIPIVVANFAALPSSGVQAGLLGLTLDTLQIYVATSSSGDWEIKTTVIAANFAALPSSGIGNGTLGIALDTLKLYVYNLGTTTWELSGGSSTQSDMSVFNYALPAAVLNKGYVTIKNTGLSTLSANKVASYDTQNGSVVANNIISATTYDGTSEPAFLVLADIAPGAVGGAIQFGIATVSCDVSVISRGDFIYVDSTGTLTNVDIGNFPIGRSLSTISSGTPPQDVVVAFCPDLLYSNQAQADFLQTDNAYPDYIKNTGQFPIRNSSGMDIPTSCAVVQDNTFSGGLQNGYVNVLQYNSADNRRIIGVTLAPLPDSGTAGGFIQGRNQISLPGTFSVTNGTYLYVQDDGTIDTVLSPICIGEVIEDATTNPVNVFLSLPDYFSQAGITGISGNIVTIPTPGTAVVNQEPADPTIVNTSAPGYIAKKNTILGYNNNTVDNITQYQVVSIDTGDESSILNSDAENVVSYDQTLPPLGLALTAIAAKVDLDPPTSGEIYLAGNIVLPYTAINGVSDSTTAQTPIYVDATGALTLDGGSPLLTQVAVTENDADTGASTILIYFSPVLFASAGGPHSGVVLVAGGPVNNADPAYPLIAQPDWNASTAVAGAILNKPSLNTQTVLATNVSAGDLTAGTLAQYASSVSGTPTISGITIESYNATAGLSSIAGLILSTLTSGSSANILTKGPATVTLTDGSATFGQTVYVLSSGNITVTYEDGTIPIGSMAADTSSSTALINFDPVSFRLASILPAGQTRVNNISGSSISGFHAVCANSTGTPLWPFGPNVQQYADSFNLPVLGITIGAIPNSSPGYMLDRVETQVVLNALGATTTDFVYVTSSGALSITPTAVRIGQVMANTATATATVYIDIDKYALDATGGSVNSVTGGPVNNTDPTNPVVAQPDWNASTAVAGAILNKPTLGQAAAKAVTNNSKAAVISNAITTPVADEMMAMDGNGSAINSGVALANLTGLTSNVQDQIDALSGGGPFKKAAAVAITNITGSSPGTDTFDGTTISVGDYLLLTAQTLAYTNGIYIFNGPSSAVTRAPVMATWDDVVGSEVSIPPSTTYPAGSLWRNTNANGGTLGTTDITFTEETGSAGATPYYWLTGGTLADAVASGKPWIVMAAENTDTTAAITLTQDTRITGLGLLSAKLLVHTIDCAGFQLLLDAVYTQLDGDSATPYGFVDSVSGGRVLAVNGCIFDNSNSDTTGNAINAPNCRFETDGTAQYICGTAPNTGININTMISGGTMIIDSPTAHNAIYDAAADLVNPDTGLFETFNTRSLGKFDIIASSFAGAVVGNFTVASYPNTDLDLSIGGSFTEFPDYSPVRTFSNDPGGSLPTPLSSSATYYVINISTNVIQLAASYEDAKNGIAITLTGAGSGAYGIMQAQSLFTCTANLISSDLTLYLTGGSNSTDRAYLTLCGTHNVNVYDSENTGVAVEFWEGSDSSELTKQNILQNSDLGEIGVLLCNFKNTYSGTMTVENFSMGGFQNLEDPSSDTLSWGFTLSNGYVFGAGNLFGFGNAAFRQFYPVINNVTFAGTLFIDQCEGAVINNVSTDNITVGLLTYGDFTNTLADGDFSVTQYTQLSLTTCTLNGVATIDTTGSGNNLTMIGTKGDATFSRTSSGVTFHGAANYSQFV